MRLGIAGVFLFSAMVLTAGQNAASLAPWASRGRRESDFSQLKSARLPVIIALAGGVVGLWRS